MIRSLGEAVKFSAGHLLDCYAARSTQSSKIEYRVRLQILFEEDAVDIGQLVVEKLSNRFSANDY
jgi:hypothetical protein